MMQPASPTPTVRSLPDPLKLAGVGLIMAAIFYFAFGGRYSMAKYGRLALQSLATINQNSLNSALLYGFGFAALFGLYWLGSRWLRTPSARLWLVVVVGAIAFNVVLLPMLPFDGADLFDYAVRGRMSALYGLNPMKDAPIQVSSDPVYPFAAWKEATSAYGPAWEALAALVARVAGNELTGIVIAYKLLSCLALLLTMLLIGLTLRILSLKRALFGVYLFAWNPITAYYAGGMGHNDFVMAACIALSLYFLVRTEYVAAILAAVFGALVKFIPALLVPIIVIVVWRTVRGAARIRTLATAALLGSALIFALYAPYWTGIDSLAIGRRTRLFSGSVATLVRQTLEPTLGTETSGFIVFGVATALFGLYCLWQLALLWRKPEPPEPINLFSRMLLFYLLVGTVWFQSWYVIWVLPAVALLKDSPTRRLALLLSYLVTWQPLLYNYVTLRYDGWMPLPWRDLIPVAMFMGGAWLYVGWVILHSRQNTQKATE